MTRQEEIRAAAAGIAPDADEALLQSLCLAAEKKLLAGLRKDVEETDCEQALIPAAAMLAVSWLPKMSSEVQQFKVGEVSVTSGGGSGARNLQKTAAALMAPYQSGESTLQEV